MNQLKNLIERMKLCFFYEYESRYLPWSTPAKIGNCKVFLVKKIKVPPKTPPQQQISLPKEPNSQS